MSVALVVLAAGASERLGACKALVDLAGRTPIERLCAAGAVFDAVPPLVVTGADHDAIAAAAVGVELAFNADWRSGRTSGVALAARLRPGLDLCIAPVDVPLVPANVFAELDAAWCAAGAPPRGWLAPCTHAGGRRHGHPIVIGRGLAPDLAGAGKDLPLRRLRGRAHPLLETAVDSIRIHDDLDTPDDLDRLRRLLS